MFTGQNGQDIEEDKYVITSTNQTTVQTLARSIRKKAKGKLNTLSYGRAHAHNHYDPGGYQAAMDSCFGSLSLNPFITKKNSSLF